MGFFSPKNTPENAVKAQIDAKLAFINDKYTEIGRFVKLRMADKIEEPEVKNLIAQIDAKQKLIMSAAKVRMVRGETHMNKVSRFISEIPAELMEIGRASCRERV